MGKDLKRSSVGRVMKVVSGIFVSDNLECWVISGVVEIGCNGKGV